MLFNINDTNGDSKLLAHIQYKVKEEFDHPLVGVEFGVAYGGGIEQVCSIWRQDDHVYGYDTFAGHPKALASSSTSPEATAMQGWYDQLGQHSLSKEYIEEKLRLQGYNNFTLVKGVVDKTTVLNLGSIHYALLDFDIPECMEDAYNLVKDKIVQGGYLCIHDAYPSSHMPNVHHWWMNTKFDQRVHNLVHVGKYLLVYKVKR